MRTRQFAASLYLCLAFVSWAGPALAAEPDARATDLAFARASFKTHLPGNRYIDTIVSIPGLEEVLKTARAVQEGCTTPCDQEAYLQSIERVCGGFHLPGADCALAQENYAPQGIPRAKSMPLPASPAIKTPKPSEPAPLDAKLMDKAVAIAAALGSSQRNIRAAPPPIKDAVVVDKVLEMMVLTKILQYPAGKALMGQVKDPPPLVLRELPSTTDNTMQHQGRGRREKITMNSQEIADMIQTIDPGAVRIGAILRLPQVLRSYLSRHPELIITIAGQIDTTGAHEMKHAAQYRQRGTDWFHNWKDQFLRFINHDRYPIEREWEAYRIQNHYFQQKAKADIRVLDIETPYRTPLFRYLAYIDDLVSYRQIIASEYNDKAAPAAKLRWYGSEAAYYKEKLAQEDQEWPRFSTQGLILMGRSFLARKHPVTALAYVQKAYDRSSRYHLLETSRPELVAACKEILDALEASMAAADADQKPFHLDKNPLALIEKLHAELKVPLPSHIAAKLQAPIL